MLKSSAMTLVSIGLSLLLSACSSGHEGELDTQHTSVALLRTKDRSCSGALIAPHLVLTARHCVADMRPDPHVANCEKSRFDGEKPLQKPAVYFTNSVDGTLSNDVEPQARTEQVASTESDAVCGNDIALLVLDREIAPEVAAPISPRFKPQALKDETFELIGFGRVSLDASDEARQRRSHFGFIKCVSTLCQTPIGAHEIQGEAGACSGDSGGPALDSEGRIIGVLSRSAASETQSCGSPAFLLMVEPLTDWIRQVASETSIQRGLRAPDWAQKP